VSAWKNKNPHRHSTLSDYLRHPFLSPSQLTKLNDIQFARQASYEWHNLPQWDCISWQGQIVVKEVFRFENLQEDWKTIQKKTEVNASLLHLTRSNRDDYRQYYDEETYRCIEKRYEKDIQTFGYTFG